MTELTEARDGFTLLLRSAGFGDDLDSLVGACAQRWVGCTTGQRMARPPEPPPAAEQPERQRPWSTHWRVFGACALHLVRTTGVAAVNGVGPWPDVDALEQVVTYATARLHGPAWDAEAQHRLTEVMPGAVIRLVADGACPDCLATGKARRIGVSRSEHAPPVPTPPRADFTQAVPTTRP